MKRVLKTVFLDLILIAVILCTFAYFHHVKDYLAERRYFKTEVITPKMAAAVVPAESIAFNPNCTSTENDEWLERFADRFTGEIIQTENSYTSPNVSVTVEHFADTFDGSPCRYHIADIYVSDISCLKTFMPREVFNRRGEPLELDLYTNAIIQINGDYTSVETGFLVRNGEVSSTRRTAEDICVLYCDGTMETYPARDYNIDEILARDPYQVWRFGPILLGSDGEPAADFNTTSAIAANNPRAAIGYYEPGHYCFVMAEGRANDTWGMTMSVLARIFSDLGCKAAYNLDGGASAVMTFNDGIVNTSCENRPICDTIYIVEPDTAE